MRIAETRKPAALDDKTVATVLADPYSRRVLAACVVKPRAVKDISHDTGLPLPTTYRHVKRLMELGVLVIERSAITEDGKRYELYRSRVKDASIAFDAKGERVTWTANEPVETRLADMWDTMRNQAGRK